MQTTRHSVNPIDGELRPAVEEARLGNDDVLSDIMREHNQRMFRIARSVLKDDGEAEDVVQDAFIKAFTQLETLKNNASIGAWLARITVNLAISRVRQKKLREKTVSAGNDTDAASQNGTVIGIGLDQLTPERLAAMRDIRQLLEREIDKLPDGFREVFVLREVEQMSIKECASALDIRPETVKTRLHRAKVALRLGLQEHITALSLKAFPFGGKRCERTTKAVLETLRRDDNATT